MPPEPARKRCIAFFDGQNLFHAAERAFGYSFLNYDSKKLAAAICARKPDWDLASIRFYTGVPSPKYDHAMRGFWDNKVAQMVRQGVHVYTRELRYTDVKMPDGTMFPQPREKGIDVRLAIDVIVLAYAHSYDVALIFSQDQDLSELVKELAKITVIRGNWLRLACAFPPDGHDGIHGGELIPFDRALYDACLDTRDYRPAMAKAEAAAKAAGIYKPAKLPFNPPRFSN